MNVQVNVDKIPIACLDAYIKAELITSKVEHQLQLPNPVHVFNC